MAIFLVAHADDDKPQDPDEPGLPPMIRLGLIRNPHSLRNRRLSDRAAVGTTDAEVIEVEPDSPAQLREALADFAGRGIGHLVVDGGDGTLRDVLSALPGAYGNRLPTLTLFAGGNANLTAVDVGSAGHGSEALQRLIASLADPAAGRRLRRRPMEVRWPDHTHAPVLGFFVGAAEFHRGWKLAVGSVHQRGFLHGTAVAMAMISAVWQVLTGGPRNPWLAGTQLSVTIDEAEPIERARFIFLATGLHRLYGNLWPFFDHGDAAIRWLDIDAPPPRFACALPGLLRGKPRPWLRASGAYRSGGASCIRLCLKEPLVIDGEAHGPGADGLIELRAGPEIEFYVPMAKA